MYSAEFDDDYCPQSMTRPRNRVRTLLAVCGVVVAFVVSGVVIGRAVATGRQEDERLAQLGQKRRPVGWVSGGDKASHSRSVISRTEFEKLVLGKSPAQVWERFPNGPMPPDVNDAESLLFIGETADPTSGAPEGEIEVAFEGGKAVRVIFP